MPLTRRAWMQRCAAAGLAGPGAVLSVPLRAAEDAKPARLPVAAVVTVYKRNSHADVIVGKILEGYLQDGGPGPALELKALYTDQVPAGDLSRDLARKHGFPIRSTIDETLTGGTDRLQVAGVLSIGEHGDYPYDERTGQHLYPRRRFFDEIAATFRRTNQTVPVFNDKHLAPRWSDARHMYETARAMNFPFMAGSSLPVAWREPPLALPRGAQIEAALGVGYGGLESYGFHALETLQCVVERRAGGETGVDEVQAVRKDRAWQAAEEGRFHPELLKALLTAMPDTSADNLRERLNDSAAFYLLRYRDGLRASLAMANGIVRNHFGVALKLKNRPAPFVQWFRLDYDRPYEHFAYLVRAFDHMVHHGKAAYPVERTLLTTGILDAAMNSLADDSAAVPTPHLNIAYQASDWPFANAPQKPVPE